MKKLIKVILILAIIPFILFAGVLGFLKYADLNKYKPQIEELALKYAQTKIKINGDIDVGISLKPSLELSDVTVYMPQNNEQKIAQIGNALVQISIMPLFHKEIVVDTIETDNTTIYYNEKDSILINDLTISMSDYNSYIDILYDLTAAGMDVYGNAVISPLKDLKETNFNETQLALNVKSLGYNLSLNGWLRDIKDKIKIEITDYDLSYKSNKISGDAFIDLSDDIPNIKLKAESNSINIADFTAKNHAYNNILISSAAAADYIAGTTIPYEYLQQANADIDFNLKKILIDPNLSVQNLSGNINVKNGVFKAKIANGEIKNIKITGELNIDSPQKLPYVKLNIKGDSLNLDEFVSVGKKQASLNWLINNAYASTLMPNKQIPYQYLKMANADMFVALNKLVINKDIALNNINTDLTVKNGVFKADIKSLQAGNGNVNGALTINSANQSASADIKGKDIILQNLYKPFSNTNHELYIKSGGKSDFLINVTTSGKNTDQYLANLTGKIIFFTDKSVLNIKSLKKLQGNIIVQVLENLKLNITSKETNLACAVVRADINKGLINFPKGIAFDASEFYLVADGNVNLKDEKMNLAIKPFSGRISDTNISSILGGLLKIKGTINQPKIALNQTETAKNVISAIASGGAYNVGDMMLSADGAPCHTALIGTSYADYFKADKSIRGNVSKGYTSAKDSVSNISKEIKSQAKDLKKQLKGLFK